MAAKQRKTKAGKKGVFSAKTATLSNIASANVVWQCVRKNSCFLRRSNGVTLTAEPLNLTGKNSFRHSGLANKRPVGLSLVGESGHAVALETRHAGNKFKRFPMKTLKRRKLSKEAKQMKVVADSLIGYRTDLLRVARRRFRLLRKTGATSKASE